MFSLSPARADGWNVEKQNPNRPYNVIASLIDDLVAWPADRPTPKGWRKVGKQCIMSDCLVYMCAKRVAKMPHYAKVPFPDIEKMCRSGGA